jgi:hypothetical protein
MSADTQVRNTGGQGAEQPPRQADGHKWKLRTTCALLFLWLVVCGASLGALVYYQQIFSTHQPWALSALVAALGGVIGGLARALYSFSFDSYAFNHRLRTLESSQWALSVCPKLDDRFDPLWVWYLWCLEPAVGAMVGLVLALAIELGLMSLGAGEAAKADINLRLLVLGGIGGFCFESVLERIRSTVERSNAKS